MANTRTPRSKLAELLREDPSLIDDLRTMLAEGDDADEDTYVSFSVEATLDDPVRSQTGRSLKYDGQVVLDPEAGDDSPKAIVVVYLPPEAATDQIDVLVSAEGATTEGREKASRKAS